MRKMGRRTVRMRRRNMRRRMVTVANTKMVCVCPALLPILTDLILLINPVRSLLSPHFINKASEAKRGEINHLGHTVYGSNC